MWYRVNPKAEFFDWQFAFIVKCVKAEGLGVVTLDLSSTFAPPSVYVSWI